MAIKFNVSQLTADDFQTMTIRDLESILKEFGFTIVEREKRGTLATVFIPTLSWRDLLGYTHSKVQTDIRDLACQIVAEYNKESEPEDKTPTFYDDNVSPAFGVCTSYDPSIYNQPEPTESNALLALSKPTEEQVTVRIETENGGLNSKATALVISDNYLNQKIESHLLIGYAIDTVLVCRVSVFSIFGVLSIEILEVLSAPMPLSAPTTTTTTTTTTEFSPLATGAITCQVKVVNIKGKYEILESSSVNDIPVGKRSDSTVLAAKTVGSFWTITCHLTDKGSIKIDSVTEPGTPTIAAAPVSSVSSSVPATETPTVAPEPESTEPEPEKQLSSDVDAWACSDYYIAPDSREAFKRAYKILQKFNGKRSVKLLMTGAPGLGKTTVAEKFAEYVGFACYRMNCATIQNTEDWFFDTEILPELIQATDGTWHVAPTIKRTISEFSQRIAKGNCVIILDEFNRLESNMHNSLFPILDDSGKTTLHHIDFKVGKNVIFVATVNLGARFAGTFLLDDALTNRFDMIVEVKPIPFDHECAILQSRSDIAEPEAQQIVRMATILRENEYDCPTRDTIKIALLVSVGMTVRNGFEYVILRRVPEDEHNAPVRKAIDDLLNKELGTRGSEFSQSI